MVKGTEAREAQMSTEDATFPRLGWAIKEGFPEEVALELGIAG